CYVSFSSLPTMAMSLEDAIRASLKHSTVISAARQSWIASREAIGSNSSTSDLSVRLTSTGTLAKTDKHDGGGFNKSNSLGTGITLFKNLYDGGQTKENVRLAQINLQMASASYAKSEQEVILTTIEAYLDVSKARREVKLHEKNLTRLEAHVNAAKIRVEAGAATPTRLAEAKARYARARSDAILTQTRLSNAKDNFRSLTGTDDYSSMQPAVAYNLPTDMLGAETVAQSAHPDILLAIAAERAANQAFNTLQAAVRPTVAFSLSANKRVATGTSLDRDEFAAQIVFSAPLLSTNATTAKARNVAANYEAAKLNRSEAIRKTRVAAREKFRKWVTTAARLEAVLSEIEAFRLVAKGTASEAQFGQRTILDLLDAEKDVNDAELSLVTAEHDQALAAFRLKAAIGNLTAEHMGLSNVLGSLLDLPGTKNPFQTTFPFRRKIAID
ncbi:TolC family protein, partial [Candidatus Puniceispirillum sp.]|nr:TolC family protein [Candidatus Puniceispirillum sp.]